MRIYETRPARPRREGSSICALFPRKTLRARPISIFQLSPISRTIKSYNLEIRVFNPCAIQLIVIQHCARVTVNKMLSSRVKYQRWRIGFRKEDRSEQKLATPPCKRGYFTPEQSCHVNSLILSTLHCIHPVDTMSRDAAAVEDRIPESWTRQDHANSDSNRLTRALTAPAAGKPTPQARLVGKVGFFGPRVSTHSFAAVQISSYNGREMARVCCWCKH